MQIFRGCSCQKEIDDPSLSERNLVPFLFPSLHVKVSGASSPTSVQAHSRCHSTQLPHEGPARTASLSYTTSLSYTNLQPIVIIINLRWTTGFTGLFLQEFGSRTRVDNCPTFFLASAQCPRKRRQRQRPVTQSTVPPAVLQCPLPACDIKNLRLPRPPEHGNLPRSNPPTNSITRHLIRSSASPAIDWSVPWLAHLVGTSVLCATSIPFQSATAALR